MFQNRTKLINISQSKDFFIIIMHYNKQNLICSNDNKQLYFNFMSLAAHIILNLRVLCRSE